MRLQLGRRVPSGLFFRFTGVLIAGSMLLGCAHSRSFAGNPEEVIEALTTFLRAFENGDLEVMEAAFADTAVTFPRAVMSNEPRSRIRKEDFERVRGIDPQMKKLVEQLRRGGGEPPFMKLEPQDLEVMMLGDTALVTFHLRSLEALSRRTFVLAKVAGSWKIVHLHASNVVGLK